MRITIRNGEASAELGAAKSTAKARIRKLVVMFEKAPYQHVESWTFDYMYPGLFSYTNGEKRIFFTPDWENAGEVSVQVTTEEGEFLRGTDLRYTTPLTAAKLFKLVKPWLDRESQYKLVLMSFPNPDFGEVDAPAPTVTVYGSTFKVLSVLAETYINKYQLGGGNFHSEILKNGKPFGYVSYNGRVWKGDPMKKSVIVYDGSSNLPRE